ncbi:MAG: DCC1-like thiol-disulfide oxidoreductase family protein [Bacteriovoracaceae bacterium]|nr:DCC1-like thiol-disulfide oxidoreductase family protein [Bacteriovoracaceae bacterium]
MQEKNLILFFDGVCGLCNGLVDWLLPRDPRDRLRFATLQGTTAAKLLPPELVNDLDTVVVWHKGKILLRSDAILVCLSEIGGLWSLCSVLKIIPRPIRDAVYRLIAHYRYVWFGKRQTCRLPLPGERLKFLD